MSWRGASPPQVEGSWAHLFLSEFALEALIWLRHVNPKPIISPPSLNSASNSFGEYTVGDCARLSLRHIGAHTHTEMRGVSAGPRLHSQKQISP